MLARVASKKNSTKAPPVNPVSFPVPNTPPSDPLPDAQSRPSDVLVARLHELKRLTKSLHSHFTALVNAHQVYGKTLAGLAENGDGVRKEWLQESLFLPTSGAGGWAEWSGRVRDSTAKEAEHHLQLAKAAEEEVLDPLRRLRVGIKAFFTDLDKQVVPLSNEVMKERENSVAILTHLATSIASFNSTPLALPSIEDPVIVRSTAELQMRHQVSKENELLRLVILWQDRTKEFEVEVLRKCRTCWNRAKMHLETRQDLVKLTQRNEAIAADAEWNHFATLNHLIPTDTPARNLDLIDFPHRDDPSTQPSKDGLMERKKRFTQEYKEAYFVLTPAGYLHEYRSSSTPLSEPHISLFLPACTVHPLIAPTSTKEGKEKPATFIIEGRKVASGGTLKESLGLQALEMSRVYRARSYPEAQAWWAEIEKRSKTSFTAHPGISLVDRQGPAPTAVHKAGLPAVVDYGDQTADEGDGELESADDEPSEARPAGDAGRPEEKRGEKEEHVKKGSMSTALETQAPSAVPPVKQARPEKLEKTAPLVMPGSLVSEDFTVPVVRKQVAAPPAQATVPQPQALPAVQKVPAAHSPAVLVDPVALPSSSFAEPLTSSPVGINPPALPPRQPPANSAEPPSTSTIAPAPGPGTAEGALPVMVDSEALREAKEVSRSGTGTGEEKKHKKKSSWFGLVGKK
ncbi:hypothetical protein JCM11641_006159 [Rhodosporidiobolus odoratus]